MVLATALTAAGCVSVPRSGPIEKVEGPQPGWQNPVSVDVRPPGSGDKPKEIVEGYLRATSNYQPNYSVARQFLTGAAAETWRPEAGVSVYREDSIAERGNTVTLNGRLVGTLGADRAYTARDTSLEINFSLIEEPGGWRINNPPKKLMVAEYSFKSFYRSYDRYFVGNGTSLVPDPIYLPALSNPANAASALMKALLNGPSDWLKPAVTSAIPPNTSLSVDSVTITNNGIAEVPLSDPVLQLPDQQRGLLAAQVVYTLRQVTGVKGVLIKVNQQPYRVPWSDPNSQVISVDAIPQDMDPVPYVAGEELYAVQHGKVKRVTPTPDSPSLENLAGPQAGKNPVDALAVSVNNTDFAVTTNGRTVLRRGLITSGELSTLPLSGVTELLRPQFSRYGEIWDIGLAGDRQWIWRFTDDGKKITVDKIDLPVVRDQKVTAFRISPDGTRFALVRSAGNESKLWLGTIIRSDKITVDGWRVLNTTQTNMTQIHRIADIAWLDATELLVLGAADSTIAFAPFRVVDDASRITAQGNRENWDPAELAVSPWRQTAVIVDGSGHTWKYDGSLWLPFIKDQVQTVSDPS